MKCEIPNFDDWYWKNRKELYKKGLNKKDDKHELYNSKRTNEKVIIWIQ